MTNIYANSSFETPELKPDNLPDAFEEYAGNLERVAKDYRKLAEFIKTKNIKILNADGSAFGGTFSVDEIDTARLKKAGFIIDLGEIPETTSLVREPVFFIDETLDRELSDNHIDEHEETLMFSNMDDGDMGAEIEIVIDDVAFPENSSIFNIKDILNYNSALSDDLDVGSIEIEIKQVDESKFSLNLAVADLNPTLSDVTFDRETSILKYKCEGGVCDKWHYESLQSVYQSLKTVNALLSNLIIMSQDCKELRAALDFVDRDLRLLQSLLRFDYALEDPDEEDYQELL